MTPVYLLSEDDLILALARVKVYLREHGWTKHCGACPDNLMTADRLDVGYLLQAFRGQP